jgi:hypothetical protein
VARRPRPYRPRLEMLEGRCLPSTVTNLKNAGPGSLRQAILDTPPGGTVDFQPGLSGTITLTSGELLITKDLNIAGPGADVLTVSGNHASRVFDVSGRLTVTIAALTIANGSTTNGGGVSNSFGTLTLSSCTFTGNNAFGAGFTPGAGGGVYNYFGTLTINSSTFTGNTATGRSPQGGGIHNEGGSVTIASSILSSNSVGSGAGGGVYNANGLLTITNSVLSDNTANDLSNMGNGGGIESDGAALLTITSSTLSGSLAYSDGGGIDNHAAATITSTTFSGGSAYEGGGIENGGTLTVISSTLTGNSAGNFGGGIGNFSGALTVTSSTLSGNSCAYVGGGIWTGGFQGNTTSRNMLLAGNTSPNGPDLFGRLTSHGHNLIGDGTGGSGFDPTDLVGTTRNPIDPRLGPLQENGGPTQTMALLPGSPAIGAGDPTDAPMWDQRGPGFPRVVNGTIDIGAFEVQPVSSPFTVTNTNEAGEGSLRQAILNADGSADPVTITFAIPGSGPQTIVPLSPLPALTTRVVVDGTSQPGYASQPLIVLDGSGAGAGADGLTVAAGNSTVAGLAVNLFSGAGMHLENAGGDLITGDYLGTDATGSLALGNRAGVFIDGTADNTVGGATAAAGNLIAGNTQAGVAITGSHNLVNCFAAPRARGEAFIEGVG